MSSTYVNISAENMRDFLKIEKGWKEGIVGKEISFDYSIIDHPFIVIRVCSGIRAQDQNSRAVGRDAIRVFAINTNTNQGWIATKRTYRTTGWQANLKENIINCIAEAKNRIDFYRQQQIRNKARVQNNRAESEALHIESNQF